MESKSFIRDGLKLKSTSILFLLLSITQMTLLTAGHYKPTWESLDSRPLPQWYDDAKLGIFVHWGVFSVPSFSLSSEEFSSEWFWYDWKGWRYPGVVNFMRKNYRPDFTYADFAKAFTAEFFNANEWAKLFQRSGARYLVFVAKHHEGFNNWDSKYSFNWNSVDVGPKRDIVGELMNATRSQTDLKFGIYHSLYEWFNPLYMRDKSHLFLTQDFVEQKTLPELYELVNKYKPEIVWSDGDSEAPDVYWKSREFLAWLYNSSPVKDTVVVNDRWGSNIGCHHGGFYTCGDRFDPGVLLAHKWENAMTIDGHSWGFRRNADLSDYLSIEELLQTFVKTISCGGNMLMNVGPPHHGHITPIYEERLRQMGSWLKVNGEAVYASRTWNYQNDTETPSVWYTKKTYAQNTDIYAFVFHLPEWGTLALGAPTVSKKTQVTLLGHNMPLSFRPAPSQGLDIFIPPLSISQIPCKWLWVFKITAVTN
ncbi:alpha-L-fucosidase isoform X1 [Aplysia californica]|uniref:alpha-L-fucosidase n=1 Tax=Aplysia californica TaxID=6500 RepID=A0ABM1A1K8_APLCA|nr:alpha-L-fucosidase isoform X1 [Aplysia californica]